MRYLGLVGLLTVLGCAGQKGLTPQDFAQAGACYAQAATLVQTAQQQVSACIELAKTVRTKAQ